MHALWFDCNFAPAYQSNRIAMNRTEFEELEKQVQQSRKAGATKRPVIEVVPTTDRSELFHLSLLAKEILCRERQYQTRAGSDQHQTTNSRIVLGRTGSLRRVLVVSQRTPCPLWKRLREAVDGSVEPKSAGRPCLT